MLERAAATGAEVRARRRLARTRHQQLKNFAARPLVAALAEPRTHAISRRGQREVNMSALICGNAVTARADPLHLQNEAVGIPAAHPCAFPAAIRNSLLPSLPRIGLSVIPATRQPGCAESQADMRSQTSR